MYKKNMISIVMVTYNRAHLLARSLELYHRQQYKDFELIVVDDDSTDDTQNLLKHWTNFLDIKTIIVRKTPGLWRDCARNINLGIRAAKNDIVVATHPEVIPGSEALINIYNNIQDEMYLACKIYYLTPQEQINIDTVDWKEDTLNIRKLDGFYNPEVVTDYSHVKMDQHTDWQSWVFGAMTRKTWRRIGGMTEFDEWGSIDMDFLWRRHLLNIPTKTLLEPRSICIHQNHDVEGNVITPRDMDKARSVLPNYPSPQDAIHKNL